ncbi:hypothetical protein VTN77DRAFT_3945 [Rasamsonia byssochlamydoides]|uniref:uncharacterized protein n=1 Tax=Rasamsonia byssochlamydoides TaxID=89139 RepID=UPI0037439603
MATDLTSNPPDLRIAIIGSGTIGLSFAALHLSHPNNNRPGRTVQVIIYDPRPDLKEYIEGTLPGYLDSDSNSPSNSSDNVEDRQAAAGLTVSSLLSTDRLVIAPSLASAVEHADIVQEQGPENIAFKQTLWPQIESSAPEYALFWSSTSGIPASVQGKNMRNPSRLLIVHPFNPPHIMPLLEIVPPAGEGDSSSVNITRTLDYWKSLGRSPVVLKEEVTGFVANRLAFALLREAVHLVNTGVVTAEEVDRVVEESMGPRWAVRGPFWSYHAGGGKEKGLRGFLEKIGDTVQACWDDAGSPNLRRKMEGEDESSGWEDRLCEQVEQAYGGLGDKDLRERDRKTRKVLEVTRSGDF